MQRLRPPHWRAAPSAGRIAALYEKDAAAGLRAAYLNARLIAGELAALGITVDCAPVLDLRLEGAHDIIGDRAYGSSPDQVAALGRAVCDGLLAGAVLPVVKHLPGHGRALEDSHHALPRVAASLETLRAQDFKPFAALKDAPWAMTAHIVYEAIDAAAPATQSRKVLGLVREEIGFDGLLISDDLSMKALSGDYAERARLSLDAGCDLVLHCNGGLAEMQAVAKGCGQVGGETLRRLEAGETLRRRRADATAAAGEILTELESLLGQA